MLGETRDSDVTALWRHGFVLSTDSPPHHGSLPPGCVGRPATPPYSGHAHSYEPPEHERQHGGRRHATGPADVLPEPGGVHGGPHQ